MKGGCIVKKVTNIQIRANVRREEQATEDSRDPRHHATRIYTENNIRNSKFIAL